MRIPSIKTVVTVLAILEVWLLLQVPAIGDLLFNFVVGGELPGTDKVLSPTQMMLFLMGIFVLAVGLIFKKEIMAATQKVANSPVERVKPISKPVALVRSPVVHKHKTRSSHRWPKPVVMSMPYVRKLQGALYPYGLKLNERSRWVWIVSRMMVRTWYGVMRRYGQRAASAVHSGIIWLCVTEIYLMYRLWTAVKVYSIVCWGWLRPRIERFDRWIERKLRKNDQTATLLEMGSEFLATVRGWIVRIRTLFNE